MSQSTSVLERRRIRAEELPLATRAVDEVIEALEHIGAGTATAPLVSVRLRGNRTRFYQRAKRLLDVIGAFVLLVLFSPLLVVIWLILMVTTRGRPIFRQIRVGEGGRLFTLYKFRTMVPNAEALQDRVKNELDGPVFKNRRDPRVTRFGRFLRKFSLDELPQLFNVLKGDMSLVGPRPPVPKEVLQYEPWQLERLSVKPGLTGLWQVSGRADLPFERWVELDLEYVARQSLWLDVKILLKTPWAVLSGKGAY